MPEPFTIFYAWQSDRQPSHHRYFIHEALDLVAGNLNADGTIPYHIHIDQDTQGVPGLCDIPATILTKIESCDAFVADLTYVAKTDADGENERHCSNPNVLFELGFAFKAVGWERLVCVLNDTHGPSTEQIFDLDHRRHALTYTLPQQDKSRREILDDFVDKLEAAIREIVPLGPRLPIVSVETERVTASERDQFRDVQAEMPELIAEMQQDLTNPETRILREFFVLKSTWHFTYSGNYLAYHLDKHDNLQAKITLLENKGYITDVTTTKTKKYRFTDHFVELVTSLDVDDNSPNPDAATN